MIVWRIAPSNNWRIPWVLQGWWEAVRYCCCFCCNSGMSQYCSLLLSHVVQVCVALLEWSMGTWVAQEFTANVFTDVYLGHIATLKYIKNKNSRGHDHLLQRLSQMASCITLTFKNMFYVITVCSSDQCRTIVANHAYLDVHHMQMADSDVDA